MKKYLVIHPADSSTEFLAPIYKHLENKTVIRTTVTPTEMNYMIREHDQVIVLGHGCPAGLFNIHQDSTSPQNYLLVSKLNAEALAEKDNNVFIWCHASSFLHHHKLRGFATGMFISEPAEAMFCLPPVETTYYHRVLESAVAEQNHLFARLVGENIHLSVEQLYNNVSEKFIAENIVSCYSGILQYNADRLTLSY